ncbi:hypothetical protein AAA294_07220 [Fusobacterium varium]|uniref:hypothetical protein n=1 Tax=Fusobacterium varium TaxID=856 RepID=UPI0032C15573
MRLKTILFKLGLRKLRDGDFIIVRDEKGIKKFYRVIGKQFNIKKDIYNKHETKGRVAILALNGFEIHYDNYIDFHIATKYIGYKFNLVRTYDVKEVY